MSTSMTSISASSYLPSDSSSVQTFYNHPHSSLSASYNINMNNYSDDEQSLTSPDGGGIDIPPTLNGYGLLPSMTQDHLLSHYFHNVLPIQYLLADSSITDFMANLIHNSASARDAACMLSALHLTTVRAVDQSAVTEFYQRVRSTMLVERRYDEGDAMAGLHIVSSFLFSGGRGNWEVWLGIASQYAQNILNNPAFYGPEEALRRCSESTRFIIKTTMWFDVLASVTTQQVPRFLETYRRIFNSAFIGDPLAAGGVSGEETATSMLPVMGCENKVVLAIAEISNLAHWKESMLRRGRLSYPELVQRGLGIEDTYLAPNTPVNPIVPLQPGMYGPPALASHTADSGGGGGAGGAGAGVGGGAEAEVIQRRRLTNAIFRASAKVYLHTVLSGDYPACPEIVGAVTETIGALHDVPEQPSVHRSVVRSVVFGICLSGCLTDDRAQRAFLLKMLDRQQQESVGNIREVARLMQQVWARRDHERERGHTAPVDWREVMRETHQDLLLLV